MSFLRIAHRGGAALRPENTLSAFADAMARGADGAELDVQLTRDGHVVVVHDFRLKPDLCRYGRDAWLAEPGPKIVDLTLSEIRRFDVGRARPGSEYERNHPLLEPCDGERIPLLSDVVEVSRHAPRSFRLFVELKSSFADPSLSASPELLADKTLEVLRATDCLERAIFVGFDWRGLLRVKAIEPDAPCWFTTLPQSWFGPDEPPPKDAPPSQPELLMLRHWACTGSSPWAAGYDAVRFDGSIVEAIKAAGGDGWFPYWRDATQDAIADAHRLGLSVGAWTVDDPAEMQVLVERGVDAICTDRTDLVVSR